MQHMQDADALAQTQLDAAWTLLESTLAPQVWLGARKGWGDQGLGDPSEQAAQFATAFRCKLRACQWLEGPLTARGQSAYMAAMHRRSRLA